MAETNTTPRTKVNMNKCVVLVMPLRTKLPPYAYVREHDIVMILFRVGPCFAVSLLQVHNRNSVAGALISVGSVIEILNLFRFKRIPKLWI